MLNTISLSAMRIFEAAARLGSFRRAAEELNLSPSAVSHAIVRLESDLGASLFERNTRSIALTLAGQTLLLHASNAFEELRRGVELISSKKAQLLRLHCAPSFAAQVLSPRLPGFLKENPGIEVRVAASTNYARFVDNLFDADIVYGEPQNRDDLIVIPLGEELVFPMCSPEVAQRLKSPRDLLRHPLIRSDLKRIQWIDWFEANQIGSPPPPAMSFDRSFLALDAAVNSLGVALESNILAARELESGKLVRPFSAGSRDNRYIGHYLAYPKTGTQRRLARIFADWLIQNMHRSTAAATTL
ncbi:MULTISPECIES: LysR substrate-binding domain-containing protein [Rhizobium]|jgi:LysR family glycine cleavage system transcriptional activator|uniref:HTH-type transcriptional regulator TtuA n=1 Tax=Rhizobium anhuiense TaxID=1184720 RepID=A0A432NLT8_9HYPH|nr:MULTISPECIES: LysR substrate-binding domain-containing protein [Rhizobium]KZS55008.1 LysR family transcriptional regulator [Rhizobium anhuiense bv. trifolii]MBB3301693.1 DNA-binding transcriptional LysR family regulator [Rhizobium sp. BK112]MBB3370837.1 DNA-binding transcriptional LysR family regulator [Rhizobium sp. BK077]MBB3746798.1 DNA-binding transcriptional LysR family regulator [Rhizobium sp. BK591]MBB4115475.1 DNA-binding transcriptional LysR family regulator [Rhizobium sp. BK226]